MYSKVTSASFYGIKGEMITVEADIKAGLPGLTIVGLPDASVRESKDRIRSAIINSGCKYPQSHITVNLVPADSRKEGSHFDLPIAVSILASSGEITEDALTGAAFIGELSLDGSVNGVRGALPLAAGLRGTGITRIYLPAANINEVYMINDLDCYPVSDLRELVMGLKGKRSLEKWVMAEGAGGSEPSNDIVIPDFVNVYGQQHAKRALTIAAAAMHNVLMTGPPGVGKSLLAKCMPGILPPLSFEEQLELTMIYSAAGLLRDSGSLMTSRPFRAPHHTISDTAMTGGGKVPKPGEISLAHYGVLFLDEFPEFTRRTIESLRQPLENEYVEISRSGGRAEFPAKFLLIGAMNPCRCGYYGDPSGRCTCTQSQIQQYHSKLSGPIMDRFDISIDVQQIDYSETGGKQKTASTSEMRSAVMRARDRQLERFAGEKISYNSQMTPVLLEKYCVLDGKGNEFLNTAYTNLKLSVRACHRILKLARTIADIEDSDNINVSHIAEAVRYRGMRA